MAGFAAHGATFTFAGSLGSFAGAVVGITVETPVAEVVDMTAVTDVLGAAVVVPTGDWTGGTISVDFIATAATGDIQNIVRGIGPLVFSSPQWSVSRRAILESANVDARMGEIVRGSAKFRVTDYQGT
jgi:hypothetical protein